MPDRPETSTVRSALTAVGAVEDALDVTYPEPVRVEAIIEVIGAVRDLRAHQVDDLVDYLSERSSRDRRGPVEDEGPSA